MIVTVIGRGHSGTRIISHTLSASGFFMGSYQNESGDTLHPRFGKPRDMYSACKIVGRYVQCKGLRWDFSTVLAMKPTDRFVAFVTDYLNDILNNNSPYKGWKLPETILMYPWIVKMFPNVRYIYLIRDPRDCILGEHITDDLELFGVTHPLSNSILERRAISWKYQAAIFKATPEPKHLIKIRHEDFVLDQDNQMKRLSDFLGGVRIKRVATNPMAIGRWKRGGMKAREYKMFEPEIKEYGYEW